MKWFVDEYASQMSGAKIKVLDVGSYNVNGTYKDLFASERYEYVGMDMEKFSIPKRLTLLMANVRPIVFFGFNISKARL